ncbi:hypothetical protein G6F64_015534 [Rhizopus arrhizus]|uniref:Uncharacterized protein n=1 Tax=Rhizopus oryzae TaxID=64495 RepID=A0A9P6WR46_RHIOR|nr:hypothetical protein G6F64_015534 [Rhizopus arrhizus]
MVPPRPGGAVRAGSRSRRCRFRRAAAGLRPALHDHCAGWPRSGAAARSHRVPTGCRRSRRRTHGPASR